MKTTPLPEHLDRESRLQRLYDTLKNMGLFVSPIFVDGSMDSFHVAVDLPRYSAQGTPEAGVVAPMESPKVADTVATTEGVGDNVVDFPTVV